MTNRITVYGHLGRDAEVKDVKGKRVLGVWSPTVRKVALRI